MVTVTNLRRVFDSAFPSFERGHGDRDGSHGLTCLCRSEESSRVSERERRQHYGVAAGSDLRCGRGASAASEALRLIRQAALPQDQIERPLAMAWVSFAARRRDDWRLEIRVGLGNNGERSYVPSVLVGQLAKVRVRLNPSLYLGNCVSFGDVEAVEVQDLPIARSRCLGFRAVGGDTNQEQGERARSKNHEELHAPESSTEVS